MIRLDWIVHVPSTCTHSIKNEKTTDKAQHFSILHEVFYNIVC